MATLNINPDDLYRKLAERIGALEVENTSLRLLLEQAAVELDTLRSFADQHQHDDTPSPVEAG